MNELDSFCTSEGLSVNSNCESCGQTRIRESLPAFCDRGKGSLSIPRAGCFLGGEGFPTTAAPLFSTRKVFFRGLFEAFP